jgi:hypothetical protein
LTAGKAARILHLESRPGGGPVVILRSMLTLSLSLVPAIAVAQDQPTPPPDPATLGASAARPGDEQMSCEAIIAEMRTLQVSGVSAQNAAEAQAAGQALRSEMDRQQTAAAGQMAAGTAATAAASAAAAAGAQGANQALLANQVAAQAQAQANAARMAPMRDRATAANAAAMTDLMASIQSNPRFGRLIGLAGARGCSGDF